jgi:hypothetical protein
MSAFDDVRQGLALLELAPLTSQVLNRLVEIAEAQKKELTEQVAVNTELQKAIGKERDQVERLRNALFILNARFHSVCNGIGPHVHALYLEDLAEVRAILHPPETEPQSGG